jgi:hypothetical protein
MVKFFTLLLVFFLVLYINYIFNVESFDNKNDIALGLGIGLPVIILIVAGLSIYRFRIYMSSILSRI